MERKQSEIEEKLKLEQDAVKRAEQEAALKKQQEELEKQRLIEE